MSINASSLPSANRIGWIDTAKGLGLLLVVYGHFLSCAADSFIFKVIYSFHMPMFFMLSGFLVKPLKQSLGGYIHKKTITLLAPPIISIMLMLPLFFIEMRMRNIQMSAAEIFATIFYYNGRVAFNIPVWFFITLFEISVLGGLVRLGSMPLWARLALSAACFILGYFIYSFKVFILFGLDKAVIALGFYALGSALSVLSKAMKPYLLKVFILLSACAFILLTALYTAKNPNLSMYDMTLGNYWCFLLLGITGSVSLFGLCALLSGISVIKTWGQNTVFVVATHILPYAAITLAAQKLGICDTALYTVGSLAVSIVLLFAYMPICGWVNRRIPIMNGRGKQSASAVNM